MLSFLLDFPVEIIVYKAVIRMIIGIIKATMPTFIVITLKTESIRVNVCPAVNNETRISILFHDLNS
jgi:hypothetical protein